MSGENQTETQTQETPQSQAPQEEVKFFGGGEDEIREIHKKIYERLSFATQPQAERLFMLPLDLVNIPSINHFDDFLRRSEKVCGIDDDKKFVAFLSDFYNTLIYITQDNVVGIYYLTKSKRLYHYVFCDDRPPFNITLSMLVCRYTTGESIQSLVNRLYALKLAISYGIKYGELYIFDIDEIDDDDTRNLEKWVRYTTQAFHHYSIAHGAHGEFKCLTDDICYVEDTKDIEIVDINQNKVITLPYFKPYMKRYGKARRWLLFYNSTS